MSQTISPAMMDVAFLIDQPHRPLDYTLPGLELSRLLPITRFDRTRSPGLSGFGYRSLMSIPPIIAPDCPGGSRYPGCLTSTKDLSNSQMKRSTHRTGLAVPPPRRHGSATGRIGRRRRSCLLDRYFLDTPQFFTHDEVFESSASVAPTWLPNLPTDLRPGRITALMQG